MSTESIHCVGNIPM